MMSIADLLIELNNHLADYSYIGGYELSQEDLKVFTFANDNLSQEEMSKYLYFGRWFRHLKSFTPQTLGACPSALITTPTCTHIISLIEQINSNSIRLAHTDLKAMKQVSSAVWFGMLRVCPSN